MELPDECGDIGFYLDMHIETIENSSDDQQIATHCTSASDYFEALAICELVGEENLDMFFHHLIRSAQTKKWLLLRQANSSEGLRPGSMGKVGDLNPQFCAIASGQLGLAIDIARLSPARWEKDLEYEDDFCYGHFVNRFLLGADQGELEGILGKFDTALEGQASVRLDLCREFLSPEKASSTEKFVALLESRDKMLKDICENSAFGSDALYFTNSTVFVEGLAWLALFERKGIYIEGEFLLCPSGARTRQYAPFEVRGFPHMAL